MGGSSKSSSSSSSNTTTTNIDRRQVVAEGAFGIAADGATVNIQSIDGGIVKNSLDAVKASLDTVKANDAVNGAGFTQLLDLADKFLSGAGEVINKTQDTTIKQIDQINTAANDQKGSVDQKTLMIVAGAAVAVLALRKK